MNINSHKHSKRTANTYQHSWASGLICTAS